MILLHVLHLRNVLDAAVLVLDDLFDLARPRIAPHLSQNRPPDCGLDHLLVVVGWWLLHSHWHFVLWEDGPLQEDGDVVDANSRDLRLLRRHGRQLCPEKDSDQN